MCPDGWSLAELKYNVRACIDFSGLIYPEKIQIQSAIYDRFKNKGLIVNEKKKRISFLCSNTYDQCKFLDVNNKNLVISNDPSKVEFYRLFYVSNQHLMDKDDPDYNKILQYDFVDTSMEGNYLVSLKQFKDSITKIPLTFINTTSSIVNIVDLAIKLSPFLISFWLYSKYDSRKTKN